MRTSCASMQRYRAVIPCFISFLSTLVYAADQYYSPTWVVTAGGPASDSGDAAVFDGEGNIYVTGAFDDAANFGSITAPPQPDEAVVAKLSSHGSWLWAARPSGNFSVHGHDLAIASDGTVFVAGALGRTATFGDTTLTYNVPGVTVFRPFVASLDPNGEWLWAAQGAITQVQQHSAATAVCLDSAGNVYLTGYFYREVTFGSVTLTASIGVFVAKYDNTGNVAWAVHIPNSENSEQVAIDVDNSGNVYVAGASSDAERMERHAFVTKLSPNGVQLWFSEVLPAGQSGFMEGSGVVVDSGGSVYTTGFFLGDISFGNITLNGSAFEGRIYLAKVDSNGNWVWATTLDGSPQDSDRLSLADDQTLLVGSRLDGSTVLRLFDLDGNLQHRYRLHVPAGNALVEHRVLGGDGHLLVAGTLQGNATHFSGVPVSPRNSDVFVAKLLPLDTDQDALSNYEEGLYGTNLNIPDTDGDGVLDGVEIALGTDPLDAGDFPSLPVVVTSICVLILAVSAIRVLKGSSSFVR